LVDDKLEFLLLGHVEEDAEVLLDQRFLSDLLPGLEAFLLLQLFYQESSHLFVSPPKSLIIVVVFIYILM
jgi:hypothetical protein